MNIIAHRGMWTTTAEQNSEKAFERAFLTGFGIEFDVRDHYQLPVVSHDMPSGTPMPLAVLLETHACLAPATTLAINIKADGMAEVINSLITQYQTASCFVFDMSVPDMRHYLQAGVSCLARHSEFEPFTALHDEAQGVWFDGFNHHLPNISLLEECLHKAKTACVVSAELHGKEYHAQWAALAQLSLTQLQSPHLMLCTDEPQAAQERFNA